MNWYKKANFNKYSSVTFRIDGTEKISEPMTKEDICNDLLDYVFYNTNLAEIFDIQWNDIDPDMSSGNPFDYTGSINFYLTNKELTADIVNDIIQGYNNHKAGEIKLKVYKINKSGQYGRPGTNVARILIEQNNTVNLSKVPYINISNDNAKAFLSLLINEGLIIDGDFNSGSFNAIQALNILNDIDQNDFVIDPYIRQNNDNLDEEDDNVQILDFGLSKEQIMSYIYKIKEMINYINQNNLPNKTISYF